jgi:predicted Kef-type K+ transport protein
MIVLFVIGYFGMVIGFCVAVSIASRVVCAIAQTLFGISPTQLGKALGWVILAYVYLVIAFTLGMAIAKFTH